MLEEGEGCQLRAVCFIAFFLILNSSSLDIIIIKNFLPQSTLDTFTFVAFPSRICNYRASPAQEPVKCIFFSSLDSSWILCSNLGSGSHWIFYAASFLCKCKSLIFFPFLDFYCAPGTNQLRTFVCPGTRRKILSNSVAKNVGFSWWYNVARVSQWQSRSRSIRFYLSFFLFLFLPYYVCSLFPLRARFLPKSKHQIGFLLFLAFCPVAKLFSFCLVPVLSGVYFWRRNQLMEPSSWKWLQFGLLTLNFTLSLFPFIGNWIIICPPSWAAAAPSLPLLLFALLIWPP